MELLPFFLSCRAHTKFRFKGLLLGYFVFLYAIIRPDTYSRIHLPDEFVAVIYRLAHFRLRQSDNLVHL